MTGPGTMETERYDELCALCLPDNRIGRSVVYLSILNHQGQSRASARMTPAEARKAAALILAAADEAEAKS